MGFLFSKIGHSGMTDYIDYIKKEGSLVSGNKIVKSVSLNLSNADDVIILKAVKRRNFSGYVKGLILADIKAKEAKKEVMQLPEVQIEVRPEPEKVLTAAERLEALKRQKSEPKPAASKPFINPAKN